VETVDGTVFVVEDQIADFASYALILHPIGNAAPQVVKPDILMS
jgi:hypothetical protein